MAGESGNIIRNIFGKSYKEAHSIFKDASKGALDFKSPNENTFYGKKGGKKLDEYKPKKDLLPVRVMLVKCYEDFECKKELHKAEKNQKYFYKVLQYNRKPTKAELKNLKWAIQFDGGILANASQVTGDEKVSHFVSESQQVSKVTAYPYFKTPVKSVSVEILINPKVVILFIGGAGDKRKYSGQGPNHNIVYAQKPFDKLFAGKSNYKSLYLGYYEINPETDITKYVESQIQKGDLLYIVGHSLGGWNAAHLSAILSNKGYDVEMLVTLDPVGEDLIINSSSEMYFKTPKPKAKFWINIFVDAESYSFSDFIADMGVQWIPKDPKPNISHTTKHSHLDADLIFIDKMSNGKSASDMIFESINSKLK